MIKGSVWQNPNKEWGIITKSMIERNWSLVPGCLPSDKMISHAKELEMKGVLPSRVLESLAERIKEKFDNSSLPEITFAASLAHHGYLGSVETMFLWDVDLTTIPADHLSSLVSRVTKSVGFDNVIGLVTILDSAKSLLLEMDGQSLGTEETQALLQAMKSRVEMVRLRAMRVDIRSLMEYSGQGKCRMIVCYGNTEARYRDQMRTWATSRNWVVTDDYEVRFVIRRM